MNKCRYHMVFFSAALILIPALCRAEKLYVFHPSTMRPHIVQKKLMQACPGVDITVFGRFKDFEVNVKSDPPDAILTKPEVIRLFERFEVNLTGMREGKPDEAVVLVSIEKKIQTAGLSDITIGTIDLMGRKRMKDFLSDNLPSMPKIKLVNKIEDLIPLLRFNMVDAVIIPENLIDYFKENSKMNFAITKLNPLRPGIAALAVKKKTGPGATIKAIKSLSLEQSSMFGVDAWK